LLGLAIPESRADGGQRFLILGVEEVFADGRRVQAVPVPVADPPHFASPIGLLGSLVVEGSEFVSRSGNNAARLRCKSLDAIACRS
jgi:hypothetical protein